MMPRHVPSPSRLLRDLIALPSVNPAFAPPGHPCVGERAVAEYLATLAGEFGLEVRTWPALPGRPNLWIACKPASAIRHRVLLAPHLDTVGGDPLEDQLFKPRVRGGRIYGRGACDTKGSVAAMFLSLLAVASGPQRPRHTEIVFAGLVDEENNQMGSRALARDGVRADLAIVGEPTRARVITAHKGSLWLRLETTGRPAHGSTPELGRNAIHTMARIVHALESEYAAELRARPRHPLLGGPTISVGRIAGGTQPNVVPARCTIDIDRRTVPGERGAAVGRELQRWLRRRSLRATLTDRKGVPCEPMETNPGIPFVRQFLAAARQSAPLGARFFCDASVLAAAGIPSVVFGPGDIAQAHTRDEWIAVASLERATALLTTFLRRLP
jgi:acetylornithine deacetylase/succinyl-diaminopimelate desuccinylase-like protein